MSQPDRLALSPATRPTWKTLLDEDEPLLLPAAHDALAARLIARAGFKAYQVGGFALAGARYAYPDIDLVHLPRARSGSGGRTPSPSSSLNSLALVTAWPP